MIDMVKIYSKLINTKSDLTVLCSETILCEDPEGNELESYAKVIKNIAAFRAQCEAFLRIFEMTGNELMFVLHKEMKEKCIDNIETDDLIIKIKTNPPRLVIEDEDKLDKEYFFPKLTLDKFLIRKNIKEGMCVPGCELVQDERVEIKYKAVKAKECV